jgi:hypothetical protein
LIGGRGRAALIAVLTTAALSCEGQIEGPGGPAAVSFQLLAPPATGFEAVADALQPHCGTLDCHGQVGRNMRLFGARGLRLDPTGDPADGSTTPAEYNATYWAVVGLEPEIMTAVVRDQGANPERLSLIRKARGHERHKGGTQMQMGDDLDRCLTSWLSGTIATTNCRAATMFDAPGGPLTP